MADITYPLFPIFAFLGCILPLIPLPWHLQALNSGTCFFIFWSSLACLNQFVNSVVWHNNALNPSPVWCDISIRIMMGASVGIPAASLCIHRRLYQIACIKTAPISYAQKRRGIIIDTVICVLVPIMYIALQYVVQGHRFNILEDIGCYPAIYNTIPAFFISSIWPVVFGLISSVYCFLSLRSFAKRRVEFSQFLSSNSALTVGRYFRLMGLALAEICTTTPLAIFMIWLDAAATPVGPWRSWDDTHFAYSRMEQIVASTWRSNHLLVIAIELSRWVNPMCSFTFFAFFGFAQESRKNYRLAWNWIRKSVGFPVATASSKNASSFSSKMPMSPVSASIPTFNPMHDLKRTDSVSSTVYGVTSNKASYLDSYPSTPQTATVTAASPPSYRLFMNTLPTPSNASVPLSRSMTL